MYIMLSILGFYSFPFSLLEARTHLKVATKVEEGDFCLASKGGEIGYCGTYYSICRVLLAMVSDKGGGLLAAFIY